MPLYCILDLTLAGGCAERAALHALRLAHGHVTFATAGPRSKCSAQVMQSKIMVARDPASGAEHRWTGSVNCSEAGWLPDNCVTLLRSEVWAEAFCRWYGDLRAWAQLHARQF